MKTNLSKKQKEMLDKLVAETEKKTGVQIVLAVIKRSDSYAELPWKAFALGSVITGLFILILGLSFFNWYPEMMLAVAVSGTLAGGVLFAFLTVLIPDFAKRFLSGNRAETEVLQYAQSLFLERELFATGKRTGILLLVSLFERKVVILPDKGLETRLTENDLQKVIGAMTPNLKEQKIGAAFETGLEKLSHLLGTTTSGYGENELPDEIIEEKGV